MANYTNLDNPSVNLTRLIKEQNDAGWTAGSLSGKEPFEVLISKSTFSLKQQIDAFITDALPSLTGNSGKVLTNNGTVASWTDSPSLSSLSASGAATVGSLVTSVITGSPTISGNLTVSGNLTTSGYGIFSGSLLQVSSASAATDSVLKVLVPGPATADAYTHYFLSGVVEWKMGADATNNKFFIGNGAAGNTTNQAFTIAEATYSSPALALTGTGATFAGNLTVNGTGNQVIGGVASRLVLQGGTAITPASAAASGTAGSVVWDASYIYVCTATNTWKRAAIATW